MKAEHTSTVTPGFLSIASAADWADVSVKTLKRWMARGLPWYQAGPGEKVLIRPGDIEGFLTRKQTLQSDLDRLIEEALADLIQPKPEN